MHILNLQLQSGIPVMNCGNCCNHSNAGAEQQTVHLSRIKWANV